MNIILDSMKTKPELSSVQKIDTIESSLQQIDGDAKHLYKKLQEMPKEKLSLEDMQKVISLMLELKKRIPPEELIQISAETAKKMPQFIEKEDEAAAKLRENTQKNVEKTKTFFSSLKGIGKESLKIVTQTVGTMFRIAKNNPQLVTSIIALIMGGKALSFFSSIFAGGSENQAIAKAGMDLAGIPKEEQELILKEGIWAYIGLKAKQYAINKVTGGTATAGATLAGASLVGNLGAKAATASLAETPLAIRLLGGLAGRAAGIAGLMMPKDMGNGELSADQIRTATPEEYAKTMKYINALPKAGE